MQQLKKRFQQGDTIVEVLLAIAIVSSVLGITYSTMNRNVLILRNNQERTEASKIAQGQIEQLKAIFNSDPIPPNVLTIQDENPFCLNGTTEPQDITNPSPTTATNSDNFANYGVACQQNGIYYYGIRYVDSGPGPLTGTYTVYVRWDRAGGGQRGEIVIVYRLQ